MQGSPSANLARMLDPVYDLRDGELHPTPLASGPWFDGVQHGGAVAGLVARAIDATPSAAPMVLTRLTLELVKKVPMGPTRVEVEVTRDGLRVQALSLTVLVNDEPTTRATALRIRTESAAVAPELLEGVDFAAEPTMPGPDTVEREVFDTGRPDFWNCFDTRMVMPASEGHATELGCWYRLLNPLVSGEEPSPLVRMICNADFVMSASWLLGFDDYISPNPDLTVALRRPVVGEWIGLHSRVWAGPNGIGQSEAVLHDSAGQNGRATKSLLIAKR